MFDDRKVVWVLGAGFSKSLGGPLLTELLSEASHDHVSQLYGHLDVFKTAPETVRWVYRVYQYGTKYEHGKIERKDEGVGVRIWRDAEVFLDELDAAARDDNSALAKRFRSILSDKLYPSRELPTVQELAAMAKRLVAAECSSFVKEDLVKTERWIPYVDWGKQILDRRDTIITFNYDRVVELVAKKARVAFTNDDLILAREEDAPMLLKMHGSVDWELVTDDTDRSKVSARRTAEPEFALQCTDEQLCIGTPGPSKLALSMREQEAAPLSWVWGHATSALTKADIVVFVGFRFPPTDAMARKRLLWGFSKNKRPKLDVHVVLGEDTNRPDVRRLEGLLKATGAKDEDNDLCARLHVHPLFAEDFLSVWERMLFGRERYRASPVA